MKKILSIFTLLSIIASKCNTLKCNGVGEMCKIIDGTPKCLCRSMCKVSDITTAYVCGDDSLIYRSRCHMGVFACQQKTTITRHDCTDRQINQIVQHASRAPTGPPRAVNYTVGPRGILTLHCGSGPVNRYMWTSNNNVLKSYALSLNQQSLHFKNIDASIAGTYRCFRVKDGTVLNANEPSKVFTVIYRHLPHVAQATFFRSTCLETWWSYKLENCFSRGVTHTRWVLDLTKKICVPRTVDRCVKIQSSFETERECNYQCGSNCDMPVLTGRKCENITNPANVVYDKNQQSCKIGGKGCGVNVFSSYTACEIICTGRRLELETVPAKSKAACPDDCAEVWTDGYCSSDFILFGKILKVSRRLIIMNIISVIKDHPFVNMDKKMHTSHTTQIALENDDNCFCGNVAYKDLKRRFRQSSTNGYLISGNYYRGRPHVSAYAIKSFPDRPYKEASGLLEKLCGASPVTAPETNPGKSNFKIATTKDFISRVNQFEKGTSWH